MTTKERFQKLTEKMLYGFKDNLAFQHNYVLKHKGQKQVNTNLRMNNQYVMNTLIKQIPNDDINLTVDNALINANISSKEYLVSQLEKQIKHFQAVHSSKNKIKKAKKAIKRLYKTRTNLIGDRATEWFNTPVGKNIRSINSHQVLDFLETLDECLGAVLLPCEQLALKNQKAFKKQHE